MPYLIRHHADGNITKIPFGDKAVSHARTIEEIFLMRSEQSGFDVLPTQHDMKRYKCEPISRDQTGATVWRCPDGSILHVNEIGCYAAEGNE